MTQKHHSESAARRRALARDFTASGRLADAQCRARGMAPAFLLIDDATRLQGRLRALATVDVRALHQDLFPLRAFGRRLP